MPGPPLPAIFVAFFRLGCTAFGGPAMIPYIRRMAVDRARWLSEDAFRVGMSLSQALPGATAMQVAAYVGLRARGMWGGLAAYTGFGLPAFGMILALSYMYVRYLHLGPVMSALAGLKVAREGYAGMEGEEFQALAAKCLARIARLNAGEAMKIIDKA